VTKRILFETDWLASDPVFYNEKTGRASRNINEIIDCADLELHPEGLNNYLDFGYSILEQTPIKNVKFLRYSSRLWGDEDGTVSVEYLNDPVEQWWDYRLSEGDIIDLIRGRVRQWEASVEGEIVIPTSAGYDSRILNWCMEDKSRVRSFSYGISENQAKSYEVVYARRLSEILGTRWEQIPLGDFHQYFDDWDRHFGVSTHAHGMYHFEFYRQILSRVDRGNPLLSGIFGDVWAGSTEPPAIESLHELNRLGYTHDLHADMQASVFSPSYDLRTQFLEANVEGMREESYRTILQIRLKMILISYLLKVPLLCGFRPWSPFLDIDICMAMLNLPSERRRGRLWQKEFFRKVGLDLESKKLRANRRNTLDLQALERISVRPLDADLLGEIIRPGYVAWINDTLAGRSVDWKARTLNRLLYVPKVGGALRLLGLKDIPDLRTGAYNAYLVLLPLEKLLRRRDRR